MDHHPRGGHGSSPPLVRTLLRLRQLHSELASWLTATQSVNHSLIRGHKAEKRAIECIRAISELIAYGEQCDDARYFELFCEHGGLQQLVEIVTTQQRSYGAAVKTQVIQAVAIMVQNIKNVTSLFLLLSNNHINHLISFSEGGGVGGVSGGGGGHGGGGGALPSSDEEFVSHYVAFLKGIGVRLGPETVQFFLDVRSGAFPLYHRALSLINHPDPLVRTSALTMTLHVVRVGGDDAGVRDFLARDANTAPFLRQLALLLREAYSQLLVRAMHAWQLGSRGGGSAAGEDASQALEAVRGSVAALQDLIYYLQDLADIANGPLLERLVESIVSGFVDAVLLETLRDSWQRPAPPPPSTERSAYNGEAATTAASASVASAPAAAAVPSAAAGAGVAPTASASANGTATGPPGAAAAAAASAPTLDPEREAGVQLSLFVLAQLFMVLSCPSLLAGAARAVLSGEAREAFLWCLRQRGSDQVRLSTLTLVRVMLGQRHAWEVLGELLEAEAGGACDADSDAEAEGGAGDDGVTEVEEEEEAASGDIDSATRLADGVEDGADAPQSAAAGAPPWDGGMAVHAVASSLSAEPNGASDRNGSGAAALVCRSCAVSTLLGVLSDHPFLRTVTLLQACAASAEVLRLCAAARSDGCSGGDSGAAAAAADDGGTPAGTWLRGRQRRQAQHQRRIELLQARGAAAAALLAAMAGVRSASVVAWWAGAVATDARDGSPMPQALEVVSYTAGMGLLLPLRATWRQMPAVLRLGDRSAELDVERCMHAYLAMRSLCAEFGAIDVSGVGGVSGLGPSPGAARFRSRAASVAATGSSFVAANGSGSSNGYGDANDENRCAGTSGTASSSAASSAAVCSTDDAGEAVAAAAPAFAIAIDQEAARFADPCYAGIGPGGRHPPRQSPKPRRSSEGGGGNGAGGNGCGVGVGVGGGVGSFNGASVGSVRSRSRSRSPVPMRPARGLTVPLGGRHCVSCKLPTGWAAPGGGGPSDWSEGLYVVFDDVQFLLATPDKRNRSLGAVLCAAPLLHVTADVHAADARVLEATASTMDFSRSGGLGSGDGGFGGIAGLGHSFGSGGGAAAAPAVAGAGPGANVPLGPGLFVRVPSERRRQQAAADERGAHVGHDAVWHLLLVFETPKACALVQEHVEGSREAIATFKAAALAAALRRDRDYAPSALAEAAATEAAPGPQPPIPSPPAAVLLTQLVVEQGDEAGAGDGAPGGLATAVPRWKALT